MVIFVKVQFIFVEPVYLHIQVHNPMHITLPLNNISPIFESEGYDGLVINEIILEPLEKRKISFLITPKRIGAVVIKGFKYSLCGVVDTTREFKGEIKIITTPSMPILEIKFYAVPDVLLSGEVVRTVLEVANKGKMSLGKFGLKFSHPSFMCMGNAEQVEVAPYSISLQEKLDHRLHGENQRFFYSCKQTCRPFLHVYRPFT